MAGSRSLVEAAASANKWGGAERLDGRRRDWKGNTLRSEGIVVALNLPALYVGKRSRRIRESDVTPPAEMSEQHETARQQSRAAWGAVARGWYAQREELWKTSRPISEW